MEGGQGGVGFGSASFFWWGSDLGSRVRRGYRAGRLEFKAQSLGCGHACHEDSLSIKLDWRGDASCKCLNQQTSPLASWTRGVKAYLTKRSSTQGATALLNVCSWTYLPSNELDAGVSGSG